MPRFTPRETATMRIPRTGLGYLIVVASLLGICPRPAYAQKSKEENAAKVRDIFQAHCLECHGGKYTRGGVKILDSELLISKDKVSKGSADDSLLFQLINATDD